MKYLKYLMVNIALVGVYYLGKSQSEPAKLEPIVMQVIYDGGELTVWQIFPDASPARVLDRERAVSNRVTAVIEFKP